MNSSAMDIRFSTEDGVDLAGEFFFSRSVRPQPLVVLVPGASLAGVGEDGDVGLRAIAKALQAKNIVVFMYEGRGFGRSTGSRERQADTITDLKAALAFVEKEVAGNCRRYGLLGLSVGGAGALKLAASNPKIGAVACYGTLPSYSHWFAAERRQKVLEIQWRESKQNLSLDDYAAQYDPIDCFEFAREVRASVFLAGGTRDADFFRWEEQLALANALTAAPSVSIQALRGWSHSLGKDNPGFEAAGAVFAAWFRETLTDT
jgi:dienelactone hydrolase